MILINYLASFFLIVLGLYCIVTKYDLLKSVIGLSIIDYGVNLLIITIGFNPRRDSSDLLLRRAEPRELLCRPDPAGPDPDEHRHRRLCDGHEPVPGDQDPGDVRHDRYA